MPARSDDLCVRCMQPVPSSASRCPNCGTPYSNSRRLTLWVGVCILLMLALLAGILLLATRGDPADQPAREVFVLVRPAV